MIDVDHADVRKYSRAAFTRLEALLEMIDARRAQALEPCGTPPSLRTGQSARAASWARRSPPATTMRTAMMVDATITASALTGPSAGDAFAREAAAKVTAVDETQPAELRR